MQTLRILTLISLLSLKLPLIQAHTARWVCLFIQISSMRSYLRSDGELESKFELSECNFFINTSNEISLESWRICTRRTRGNLINSWEIRENVNAHWFSCVWWWIFLLNLSHWWVNLLRRIRTLQRKLWRKFAFSFSQYAEGKARVSPTTISSRIGVKIRLWR